MSITDEVPFEIPGSWEWARWGSISESIQYGYNAPAQDSGRIKMVRISDIQDGQVIWNSVPYCNIPENDIDTYLLRKNDILFARTGGTVGKSYLVQDVPEEAVYAGYLIRTRYSASLCPQYLKYFMESPLYWEQLKEGTTATAQPNCNGKTLGKMLIPIPPKEEQQRIVKKFEEIEPLVQRYGSAYDNSQKLNIVFPDQLKKSILQLAVQGKLVPQDPNDEPASVLLERIHAEKERLIKEGKIKRDKNESVIFRRDNSHYEKQGSTERCIDNELPFEIPENWEWARCSSLGAMVRGRGIKRTETTTDGLPCIRYGEIYTSYNTSFVETKSFIPADIDANCLHLSHGDLVFTLTGENKIDIAKTVAYLGDSPFAAGGDLAYWTAHGMNPLYIVYFMASPYCIELKRSTATGDIIVHISTEKVGSFLIPVPPKAEQDRIVEAISSSFAIVETL